MSKKADRSRRIEKLRRLASNYGASRKKAALAGWFNWYVNRGRLSLNPTGEQLRRISYRRVL